VLSFPPLAIQVLLVMIVIPAAVFDIRSRRVPNWLTLAGLVIGIGLNVFLFELPGLWDSLKGMGLAMLIYFPLFALRGMGAGDVKLMAALGAIAGPANWIAILLLTALSGGIAALALVIAKGRLRQTFQNIWMILMSLRLRQAPYEVNPQLDVKSEKALRLPHAAVIACGTLAFLAAAAISAPR
jgi:prepilin peptidase CpaA